MKNAGLNNRQSLKVSQANICPSKLSVFLEIRSQKTVHFIEQIMSTDKCQRLFLCQMEAILYLFTYCTGEAKKWSENPLALVRVQNAAVREYLRRCEKM